MSDKPRPGTETQMSQDGKNQVEKEYSYNKERARELGLKEVELKGYPEADKLISKLYVPVGEGDGYVYEWEMSRLYPHIRVVNGRIDPESVRESININSVEGQEQFCQEWVDANPDLPMPCVPPKQLFEKLYPGRECLSSRRVGDFWYLHVLSMRRIVRGDLGPDQRWLKTIKPSFGKPEILLVASFEEEDYNKYEPGEIQTIQTIDVPILLRLLLGENFRRPNDPLLRYLGKMGTEKNPYTGGPVDIKRETIDAALWVGHPGNREPTERHKEILKLLELDPKDFEIHLIAQDQYARGAKDNNWGKKRLKTHFDGYLLAHECRGLVGGDKEYGGASHISEMSIYASYDSVATRLVISRKRNLAES